MKKLIIRTAQVTVYIVCYLVAYSIGALIGKHIASPVILNLESKIK